MNPIEKEIRSRIPHNGPLSIAEFVSLCLNHPKHGYYTSRSPIGGSRSTSNLAGDFITAPEVSQMFGEMIGVWCMEMWQRLGSPPQLNLVEIGPGRGTLMRDLLNISSAIPDFARSVNVYLIEISDTLSKQQKQLLLETSTVQWVQDLDDLPTAPTIIVANEFLDALPFRQWVKHDEGWFERAVGLVDEELTFVLRPNRLPESDLPVGHVNENSGAVLETAPAREAFIARTADWLTENKGAALFIDYGHLQSGFGDTFQAMSNHAYTNPLTNLGESDLTNHVDFDPLIKAARQAGCSAPQPTTQGQFLTSLGLLVRAGSLGHNKNATAQDQLRSDVERLASDTQMGRLFKVMAFGAQVDLSHGWPGF